MRVVVTGATGHLGGYVVRELLEQGHEIIALSSLNQRKTRPRFEGIEEHAIDLESDGATDLLRPLLKQDTLVVHLAAWHPPFTARTTPTDRRRLLEANVFGTMRLLDACRGRVPRVVYASTFEVYGEPKRLPIDEAHPTYPLTDYGATKLSGEHHLNSFAFEERSQGISLRFPAIYGPGEHTSRALPNFLKMVEQGRRPTVQGAGDDLRDQIHVRDAARAVALALESESIGAFNISDGGAHSIAELAKTAMRVADMSGEPIFEPAAQVSRQYHMSIERASRDLGFRPLISLEQGMREQLAWLRDGALA